MKYKLFPALELQLGEVRTAMLGDVSVAVIKTVDGRLYALRDKCSHMGAPLSLGFVETAIVGEDVGDYKMSAKDIIRCPWHGYEYDAATGRCLADPDHVRVRAYSVSVEDGYVVVER